MSYPNISPVLFVQFSLRSLSVASFAASSVLVSSCSNSCCLLSFIWYSIHIFSCLAIIGRLLFATSFSYTVTVRSLYSATSSLSGPVFRPCSTSLSTSSLLHNVCLSSLAIAPQKILSPFLIVCALFAHLSILFYRLQSLASSCAVLLGVFCTILVPSLTSFSFVSLSSFLGRSQSGF